MFANNRRLKATLLVVGILVVGFMLTSNFVQEAAASDSDCQDALNNCYRANLDAYIICVGRSDSDACEEARRKATAACLAAIIICSN